MYLTLKELLQYTDEERGRWERWFEGNRENLLNMPVAGDIDTTIGRLIVHIFGAETVFIEYIRGDHRTEYRSLPSFSVEQVFGFGLKARQATREYVAQLQPDDWNRRMVFDFGTQRLNCTVRKALFHVVVHELRHWAQVTRIMRERGFDPPGGHDLLFSAALE